MGQYISQADLESALSPATVLAIYNDLQNRQVSQVALNAVIDRAEGMVDSYLVNENVLPLPTPVLQPGAVAPPAGQSPVDRVLKNAALQFAVAYSYQRHSEYAKIYQITIAGLLSSADAMMKRIQSGTQALPDTAQTSPAENSGGHTYDDSNRMFVTGSDGTNNGGDW